VTDSSELTMTPRMRRDMAARSLVTALDEYVRERLGDMAARSDWVDQYSSALGKRAHMEAVRIGELPGVKHGRRVLVRRADLDAYLAAHRMRQRSPVAASKASSSAAHTGEARKVAVAILTHVGLRPRKR
jgi:excisionase family DNA binding protein